jgi:hypothetical protein
MSTTFVYRPTKKQENCSINDHVMFGREDQQEKNPFFDEFR